MKSIFYIVLLSLVFTLEGCVFPLDKEPIIPKPPTIENKKYVVESATELPNSGSTTGTNVLNQFNEFSFYFKDPGYNGGFTVAVNCSCSQFGSNYSSSAETSQYNYSFGFKNGLSYYWDISSASTYFRFTDDTFRVIELRARLSSQSCWNCYKNYLIKLRRVD